MRYINRKIFSLYKSTKLYFALAGILSAAILVSAQTRKIWLEINTNPKCGTDDICYKVMNFPKEGTAFDQIKSDFFYAVILETTEKCAVTEKERLKVQALFPKNKVFTSVMDCESSEDYTSYENIGEYDYGFVAVYGGKTKSEAEKFLQTVKATKKFPGANLRKTRILLSGT